MLVLGMTLIPGNFIGNASFKNETASPVPFFVFH
jgi:hypothetical protein